MIEVHVKKKTGTDNIESAKETTFKHVEKSKIDIDIVDNVSGSTRQSVSTDSTSIETLPMPLEQIAKISTEMEFHSK